MNLNDTPPALPKHSEADIIIDEPSQKLAKRWPGFRGPGIPVKREPYTLLNKFSDFMPRTRCLICKPSYLSTLPRPLRRLARKTGRSVSGSQLKGFPRSHHSEKRIAFSVKPVVVPLSMAATSVPVPGFHEGLAWPKKTTARSKPYNTIEAFNWDRLARQYVPMLADDMQQCERYSHGDWETGPPILAWPYFVLDFETFTFTFTGLIMPECLLDLTGQVPRLFRFSHGKMREILGNEHDETDCRQRRDRVKENTSRIQELPD